jgi:hypothetical protein
MALEQSPLEERPSRGRESPRPFPKGKKGLDGVGTKPSRREAIEGERFSPKVKKKNKKKENKKLNFI